MPQLPAWLVTAWALPVWACAAWGVVLAVTAWTSPLPERAVDAGWLVIATWQGALIARAARVIHGRARLAWAALFGATMCGLAGDVAWSLAQASGEGEAPSADLLYLVEYPFWFIGLLVLPTERGVSKRGVVAVDLAIVVAASTLAIWDGILRPAAATSEGFALMVAAGPAVGDVALIAITLFVISKRPTARTGAALVWLAASMVCFAAVDIAYAARELAGTYVAGHGWLDPAWVGARVLLMLAALRQCAGPEGGGWEAEGPVGASEARALERAAAVLSRGAMVLPMVGMAMGFGFIVVAVTRGGDAGATAVGGALLCMLVLVRVVWTALSNERLAARLKVETDKSERLLKNVLPERIAEELKAGPRDEPLAERFEAATVVFADLVGFTPMSATLSAERLVGVLDEVFTRFDALAERHGLEKIKTIGDAYMAAAGVPEPRADHVAAAARMALAMRESLDELRRARGLELALRIGVHTGSLVAGVIGQKKFAYDLWGDTVNLASRMESHGEPGQVHVTGAVVEALSESFVFEPRGTIDIKGRGAMATHFLVGPRA